MSTRTITGTTKAWLTSCCDGHTLNGDPNRAVADLGYCDLDMSHSWVLIGEAKITITIPEPERVIERQIDSLRAEQQRIRGLAEAKATELERQIQSLLAIAYEAEAKS